MATSEINVPISEVLKNITLTVKITGLVNWKIQFWIATRLIKLAARILNMDIGLG